MTETAIRAWRPLGLASLAAGLALAPLGPSYSGAPPGRDSWILVLAGLLALVRRLPRDETARLAWIACLIVTAAGAGTLIGGWRLSAIDAGALRAQEGAGAELHGVVAAQPSRSGGVVRTVVETEAGRTMVESAEPAPDLSPGALVAAGGELSTPDGFYAGYLERLGVAQVLRADSLTVVERDTVRSGVEGVLDRARSRAGSALERGMPAREGALARGFVLGQDDRLDPATREEFRRSGLAHLLAVSGQNVMLLMILAGVPLALLGVPLRARMPLLIGLIAVYVPLAGADASIQRAGVMGVAGILALWVGRPASRATGIAGAAAATLLINPRFTGDVGWQLSFAAVIGIYLLAPGLRDRLRGLLGRGHWQRGLAEGAAITAAATLATAPLIASSFEELPLGTLTANLLALPAVAPAMWLGMFSAAAGQLTWFPVEVPNALNSVLLAYLAEVARAVSRPGWAVLPVPSWIGGLLAPLSILLPVAGAILLRQRRAPDRADQVREAAGSSRGRRLLLAGLVALLCLPLAAGAGAGFLPGSDSRPPDGLRMVALDVGQGDALLLQVGDRGAVLVDTGPPGAGIARKLHRYGVDSLEAVILTHGDLDHAGGLDEVLAAAEVERLIHGATLEPDARVAAGDAGASPVATGQGQTLRLGELALEVLWPEPPTSGSGAPGAVDANRESVVLLARWDGYRALLTGDAEAADVPLDPGPVDLLKVAHHGSEDDGLEEFLRRSAPDLAWLSVGAGNRHGHPHETTLDRLRSAGAEIRRTDLDGDLVLELP